MILGALPLAQSAKRVGERALGLRRGVRRTFLSGLFFFSGCSSLSTPALKHETGETLAKGKIRISGQIESTRMYPFVAAQSAAFGIPQGAGVFQGSLIGLSSAIGLDGKDDLQLKTYYCLGGAGWRIGTKYKAYTQGNINVAAMVGYGRYSAKGTIGMLTATQPLDVATTLSTYQVDISFPTSYRITKDSVLYSGLNYYRVGVTGSSETSFVKVVAHDLGVNFGYRIGWGKFETDAELAFVRLYDPFEDSVRFVPYLGLAASLVF